MISRRCCLTAPEQSICCLREAANERRNCDKSHVAAYGCPEIVKGFCDADDICYGNMHPKISWDRTKTIGYGDDICDFKVHIKEN